MRRLLEIVGYVLIALGYVWMFNHLPPPGPG